MLERNIRLVYTSLTAVAVMLAVFIALSLAPREEQGSRVPVPLEVQSAQAWWYTTALCSSGFKRGDWIQHFDTDRRAHRSTKISHRYQVGRRIYLNIRKESVYYDRSHHHVQRRVSKGTYPVLCERI